MTYSRGGVVRAPLADMASSRSGGYEYEFVDDPVPARFQCNICMKVLKDARLTECCGQHYCDFCLTSWLKTRKDKKTCPHCRKEGFKSMINKEKIREINELHIRCTNREEGCGWVGELGALNDHLNSDKGCGYVIVNCYNESRRKGKYYDSCGEQLERRFLAWHMENECKYRPYTCEYCGHEDTFQGITEGLAIKWRPGLTFWEQVSFRLFRKEPSHYDQCAEYPLECSNKCGEKSIKRKDIKKHHEKCPLEPLECPFKDAGCSNEICRKDMEEHIESSTQAHLMLVFKSYQKLMQENQELKARLEKLEKKH